MKAYMYIILITVFILGICADHIIDFPDTQEDSMLFYCIRQGRNINTSWICNLW